MSRSNYSDDCENVGLYRHAVERSIKGKRGQAFLIEMADALDAMPVKGLIRDELVSPDGEQVCAIGAVCKAREINTEHVDYDDPEVVANLVGIAGALAAEIEWINDECGPYDGRETPEDRWLRVRKWVAQNINP